MKTVGIISEFNPFHSGHRYLIDEAKRQCSADYVVCVMSGCFVQRGEPSLFSKEERTRAALENGADLVVEMPAGISLSSADYFGKGGTEILRSLGVVTDLVFGSETGDIELLLQTAELKKKLFPEKQESMTDLSRIGKELLHHYSEQGYSYPKALELAFRDYCSAHNLPITLNDSPNDILGLSYLSGLFGTDITPHTIKRIGSDHREYGEHFDENAPFRSSTSLREYLISSNPEIELACLPEGYTKRYMDLIQEGRFITADDFFDAGYFRFMQAETDNMPQIPGIPGLTEESFKKAVYESSSWEQLILRFKHKNTSYAAISRSLIRYLLGYDSTETKYAGYVRVLGFHSNSSPLLKEIKAKSNIPVIYKLSDGERIISDFYRGEESACRSCLQSFRKDLASDIMYRKVMQMKTKYSSNEYSDSLIIL